MSHFQARRGIFAQNPLDRPIALPPEGQSEHVGAPGVGELFRKNRGRQGAMILPSMILPQSLWAPCHRFFLASASLPLSG